MLKEILLVHHTHTDWGYTTHGSQIRELHCRFIEEAIELCLKNKENESLSQFRWTCESAFIVEHFLNTRCGRLREKFLSLVDEGFIEITAGPLCPSANNTRKTIRSAMGTIRKLRDKWGLKCNVAMFCDINGLNLPWVDELCNASVKYLSMSMNFYAGSGMDRYKRFYWVSPAGNRVLVWNGQHYNMGYYWGLIRDNQANPETFVPQRLSELEHYPYDKLLVQITNIPTDNMGPYASLPEKIKEYNLLAQSKGWPMMKSSTLSQWFDYLEGLEGATDEYRGDWSDWWSSSLPNNPRSISVARESERRLSLAEKWVDKLDDEKDVSYFYKRINDLRKELFIVNEHTFGFSSCSKFPYKHGALAGVTYQLNQSYSVLYGATSLLADIMKRYGQAIGSEIGLMDNELNGVDPMWLEIAENLSAHNAQILDLWGSCDKASTDNESCSKRNIPDVISNNQSNDEYIDNGIVKVGINRRTGKLFFTHTGFGRDIFEHKLTDADEFGQLICERPADNRRETWFHWDSWDVKHQWEPNGWPKNSQWIRDRIVPDISSSDIFVSKDNRSGQIEIKFKPYEQAVKIGGKIILGIESGKSQLDIEYQINVSETCNPISLFVPFPFAFRPRCAKTDVGGNWIKPLEEQLPGSCKNWLAAYEGVYMEDSEHDVSLLWTSWDAPVFMPERICYAPEHRKHIVSAHLFSWVIHNYWVTNVDTIISGLYRFRYRINIWNRPLNVSELNRFVSERECPASMIAIRKD